MAISKRVRIVRTAGLFGAALTSLLIAGGGAADAAGMSVGCRIVRQNGGFSEGVQFYFFAGPLHLMLPFGDGESVQVDLLDGFGGGYDYTISLPGTPVDFYQGIYGGPPPLVFNFGGTALTTPTKLSVFVQGYNPVAQGATVSVGCIPNLLPIGSISSLSPVAGPAAGGTSVTISGSGFTGAGATGSSFAGATAVQFGGVDAASFTVNSDSSITAITPPGTGIVDVTVTNSQGLSMVNSSDLFTYTGTSTAVPTVTSVEPNFGASGGGAQVTITGTNFLNAVTSVQFGSSAGAAFTVTSPTTIVAVAPAGTGTTDVKVTNAGGQSATSAADQFLYTVADTHSYSGSGKSDLLWLDTSGNAALWLMNGAQVSQAGLLSNVGTAWSVVGQRDFDTSGNAGILWRDQSGNLALWLMNGLQVSSAAGLGNVPISWTVAGTGGLAEQGSGQILWRDTAGDVAVWLLNGAQVISSAGLGNVPTNWSIVGEDSQGNVFWRDGAGDLAIWQLVGAQVAQSASLGNVSSNWTIAGLGDFNGDGVTDILWRDTGSGTVAIWFLTSSMTIQSTAVIGTVGSTWSIAQTGDYDGDGKSDILWIDNTGNVAMWLMNGGQIASTAALGNVGLNWQVQSANAE